MNTYFTRNEFLEALFGAYLSRHKGFIMVRTAKLGDPKQGVRFFPRVDLLAKEQYPDDENVFYGVCPRENMKPGQESIRFLVALWAGLDLAPNRYSGKDGYFPGPAQAAKAVRGFPLSPSIVVESGLGLHLYWLFKEPVEISAANGISDVLRRLSGHFLCKAPVRLDTVLRLPETTNVRDPVHPMRCTVKFINAALRYSFADILKVDEELSKTVIEPAQRTAAALKAAVEAPAARTQTAISVPRPVAAVPVQTAPPVDTTPEVQTVFTTASASSGPDSSAATASPDTVDLLADKIADKIIERIGDKLADKVVEGLYKRLGGPKK